MKRAMRNQASRVAQPMHSPMLFQKFAGLAMLGSGYVVIVASLLHAIHG